MDDELQEGENAESQTLVKRLLEQSVCRMRLTCTKTTVVETREEVRLKGCIRSRT